MRILLLLLLAACVATPSAEPDRRGALLLIGGGLDNDNGPVYERLLALASVPGTPRIAILTAATGPQEQEAIDKTEALRTWAPHVAVDVVTREATTADTVVAIDRATALFFTGGDQQRITARYRPGGAETPEWNAMRRLLARGGVIAGASAGCAMMGERMLEGGRSAAALGIAEEGAGAERLGPRVGSGMAFLPWGLTDSHFFERDRVGRLVAALVVGNERFGLGIGEDAAVEVDLASGEVRGVSVSESLLVDAAHARRDGGSWVGLRARMLRHGDRASLRVAAGGAPDAVPTAVDHEIPVAEPGQNRQLASWRLFRQAAVEGAGVVSLRFDGWRVRAVAAGDGEVVFAIDVAPSR